MKQKIVVKHLKTKFWQEKYALGSVSIIVDAEVMHTMDSGSVCTLNLAGFKLPKSLLAANMYGMQPTSVVHQLLKHER